MTDLRALRMEHDLSIRFCAVHIARRAESTWRAYEGGRRAIPDDVVHHLRIVNAAIRAALLK